jgi:hypothetical protein
MFGACFGFPNFIILLYVLYFFFTCIHQVPFVIGCKACGVFMP